MKRIALFVLLALALPARAGLFDDEEARRQILDLKAQIQSMQQHYDEKLAQVDAASKRLMDIFNQIEKLKQDLATVRGQMEVTQFEQGEITKRQQDLYVDLDNRMRALEQGKSDQKAAAQASEQSRLDDAVNLVKAGKHRDGAVALNRYIKENPQSKQLGTAYYWLGSAAVALKDYKGAITAFGFVANQMPDDPRAPDALLGLASVSASQGDKKGSRKYLVTIIEKYPQSEAANTAKKALTVAD